MMKNEKGFTLIELVVVIVILGILAATALPKFVDMKGDAAQAAIQGAAGAMTSAMTINYAAASIRTTTGANVTPLNAANACAAMTGGMTAWDTKFSIATDGSCAASAAGATTTCLLRHSDDSTKSASATVICTG